MKIFKIQIENFRLLKDFSIDIENDLSLVVGKNNTGKTSILSALELFLNPSDKNKFSYNDFNFCYRKQLLDSVEMDLNESDYEETGIKLRLFIQYSEACNLENLSHVMMDLDPENNNIVLGFDYVLPFNKYSKLKQDWNEIKHEREQEEALADEQEKQKRMSESFHNLLLQDHSKYFEVIRKSIEINKDTLKVNEANFIDLGREHVDIKKIINFKYISARREVANKEYENTLSAQTSRIYERTEADDEQEQAIEDFKEQLRDTDIQLSKIYKDLFREVVDKISLFGGTKPKETEIDIISSLQHRELLKGNTTVVYKHDGDNSLPEYYNGLGYMNLIYMIFEIEILLIEFKRNKHDKPADINLLFIEEPEAHTHPQMQYVFIKNIKNLLSDGITRGDGENRKLQYIITTHSSHIVADSDFEDIKYLKREDSNSVVAKNLKDLKNEYAESADQYQFLTQYLTLNRAEIFFADKIILIEGDTERILIPTMLRKIDIEDERHGEDAENRSTTPLISQNISVVEVGAYSHIFDYFIDFLGVKTLIITDIDSTKNGKKCAVDEGDGTSNESLKHFYNNPEFDHLKRYTFNDKLLRKVDGSWTTNVDGKLCVVFQTKENEYHARSFEDAFININKDFIIKNKASFKGLKNKDKFKNVDNDNIFSLTDECVGKKTHFAMDIIFHTKQFNDWQIPAYIKEGLLWLKKD